MGYLYYAEYLHLFERARSAYIRQCGVSYAAIEQKGILLPVREATCRYRTPARYDDLVMIQTGISEIGRASLRFVYRITDEARETVVAEGMTQHALINREGRPQPMPAWFKEIIQNFAQPDGPVY